MADRRTKVQTYIDKNGNRRRRLVPIDEARRPYTKSKGQPTERRRESLPIDPRTRVELERRRRRNTQKIIKGSKPMEPRGNPAVVETYEDARENQMINRDVPTMKHGGEAVVRGMGCAIKGGKFEGVF
tara:strand:- start:27 stop:410 length:384 start_codon:yes stop_codon:yes gene_type:complete